MERPRTGRAWWWGPCALATIIMGVVACGSEPPPRAQGVRPIKIHQVGGTGSDGLLQYSGVIQAADSVELGFDVAGRIVQWDIDEGQAVRRGDIVARLDDRDYRAQLDATTARYRFAEAEFERQQELFESDSISRRAFDVAKRRLEVARAELAISRKAVDDTKLRANFDGVVARKLVSDFANVQAKQPVLLLQNQSSLEVAVDVPEGDMAMARRDVTLDERTERAKPVVTLSTFPDRQFPARLTELATAADPTTRTFRVTLAFDRPEDVNVQPGMTATVTATGVDPEAAARGVLVPVQCILSAPDRTARAWRIDPDSMTVTAVELSVGELTGDRIEVKEGLERGDLIALSGVQQLREGMEVRRLDPTAGQRPAGASSGRSPGSDDGTPEDTPEAAEDDARAPEAPTEGEGTPDPGTGE